VFQTLANRKPDLDAGVYAYARAGFGPYLGFFSAFGYWASACVGNASYWILINSTLGALFPALGEGNTITALLISTVGIWSFHFMVLRGVKEAAAINKIVTIAKVIPLLVFLFLVLFAFKPDVFANNLWGGGEAGNYDNLFSQVKATMLVTVFVFLGIEGASNYSRFAEKRSDVGKATVMGFLGVLALFASVSILAYGVMPREEIAMLRQPSVAGVLEAVVGRWGALFISIGLVVSVLGAYLAWALMSAEVLSIAAKKQDMPSFLARENANQVPAAALLMSTLMVQLILLATLFSADAFTFALSLTSHLSLIPFLLSAAYAFKLVATRETYLQDPGSINKDMLIAVLAVVYTLFLVFAGGLKFLVLGFLVYAPGTVLYYMTRREQGKQLFTSMEWLVFAVAVVGALIALHGLATGWISI
jgi:arginine:ornithine antiporter / lysine permease